MKKNTQKPRSFIKSLALLVGALFLVGSLFTLPVATAAHNFSRTKKISKGNIGGKKFKVKKMRLRTISRKRHSGKNWRTGKGKKTKVRQKKRIRKGFIETELPRLGGYGVNEGYDRVPDLLKDNWIFMPAGY